MTKADVDAHLRGEDEEQVRWLSGRRSTTESVVAWIERNHESWQRGGPVYNFGIVSPDGALAGMVEANTDPSVAMGQGEGEANISYGLYPEARGHGYATRAVRLLLDFLSDRSLLAAVIRVNPENKASLAVAGRCGFTQETTVTGPDGQTLAVFRRAIHS
jgi:RimJ/RimL family protein N-acetyltransferase